MHDNIPHDGSSSWPEERNAIAMYELCKREESGINCRMLAQVLNECYLSMGLKSRYVTCLPRIMVGDCHVINVVYPIGWISGYGSILRSTHILWTTAAR